MTYLLILHLILVVVITVSYYKEQLNRTDLKTKVLNLLVFIIMSLLCISYVIICYYWVRYFIKLYRLWIL